MIELIKELGFPIAICLVLLFQSNKASDQKYSIVELMVKQLSLLEQSVKREIMVLQERTMIVEKQIMDSRTEQIRTLERIENKVTQISTRQSEIVGAMNIDISEHLKERGQNEIPGRKFEKSERGLHENT